MSRQKGTHLHFRIHLTYFLSFALFIIAFNLILIAQHILPLLSLLVNEFLLAFCIAISPLINGGLKFFFHPIEKIENQRIILQWSRNFEEIERNKNCKSEIEYKYLYMMDDEMIGLHRFLLCLHGNYFIV